MRTREEIKADIDAEQAAQDASLKMIAHAYIRNYENFCKWLNKISELSHLTREKGDTIYKAVFFLGGMAHDAEPSRLNYEKRREVLSRLYDEMRRLRAAEKAAKEGGGAVV